MLLRVFLVSCLINVLSMAIVCMESAPLFAENIYQLEDITVKGEVIAPVKPAGDSLYSGSRVTRDGLELKGISATSSIYEAVDLLPGVSLESTDQYGLGKKNTRFRGIKGMFGSITVEGMPDYGIMPIGPREMVFDTENMMNS